MNTMKKICVSLSLGSLALFVLPFTASAIQQTVLLQTAGTNQTWAVPVDFDMSATNTVECIGGGGSGGACGDNASCIGTGGGGGAYAKIFNFRPPVGAGGTITYRVGAGGNAVTVASGQINGVLGGDTWFNATATSTSGGSDNTLCYAQGGQAGELAPPRPSMAAQAALLR